MDFGNQNIAVTTTTTTKGGVFDNIKDGFKDFFGGKDDQTTAITEFTTTTTTSIIETTTTTKTKAKKTKTTATKTSTSTSKPTSDSDDDSGGSGLMTYGGIALAAIVILFFIAIIIKKMNKKSNNSNIDPYQSLNRPGTIKQSSTSMYTGPVYDPSKENQYTTNDVSMGVATSVDAATLGRQQQEEMEAANAAYKTGTLPNYNSNNSAVPPVPPLPNAVPQNSMPQSYSNYNQPQQNYGNGYDQYGQPIIQQNYSNGYNQYGQPLPQQSYDNMGMNNTYNVGSNNNNPYGLQYGNNYDPNMPQISSPLALPVTSGSGVVVSATYSSSQTTSVKQPDGTVTETLDYATNSSYEVDRDYIAIYNYEPNMADELAIHVNDRIHLLEMYTDGWGYGKNVTTGQIGILPLNRLKPEEDKDNGKREPVDTLKVNNNITKRTVSMNKRPKAAETFNENESDVDDRKSEKRYSDENSRKDRRRYDDDNDNESSRKDRRRYDDDDRKSNKRNSDESNRRERRKYDDEDDDYERKRDRRRYDDDDNERRRDRRRYDDDDDYDYERRRDRRRYDDDDYERRRDRRRYDDDDERRRDRRRYDDDDYERRRDRKKYDDETLEKEEKSPLEYEQKKSYHEDNTSKSDRPHYYERKKSYHNEESSSKADIFSKNENSPKINDFADD